MNLMNVYQRNVLRQRHCEEEGLATFMSNAYFSVSSNADTTFKSSQILNIKTMTKVTSLTASLLFASLLFVSCKNSADTKTVATETTEMTENEKEIAKNEISAVNTDVIKSVNELNVDAALKGYSADFRGVNADGSSSDYQSLASGLKESFGAVNSLNFIKVKEDFKFLSKRFVLCTWTGTVEPELKTGERMRNDPHTASLLYSKIDNKWKIVYEHDSEAPAKVVAKK